ncbi:ABC transporter ATP-binding protein/permease [Candidatus Berkiella cookevillensis]|uniref:ABC transporter ATP-binding protein/permease n=1 Tax=Candidatus Berkiella cookevillensis TaxID=437022 RepID=A0A0Q9YGK2_9GAMM|nr:ABC transporter ATP-binding protein [Candidatus Berkiella cookevillensis]MCS5707690.1 ABC transporter ATP-binding protein/permease [Candidatus Berkiella cookevillensis]
MFGLLKNALKLFSKEEKKKIAFLLCGVFLMAVIEVFVIASIMPFMVLVTDPTIIQNNVILQTVYNSFAFQNERIFLLALGVIVFFVIVVGNAFSAYMTWKTIQFSYVQGKLLSQRLFKHYLEKNYEFFIVNHSTELTKNILHEVNRFVTGLLVPVMQMLVKSIVSLFILAMLFYIDPLLAITITLLLGSIYCFIYLFIKGRLSSWGKQSSLLHAKRYKIIGESFDGIKEIKLGNKEDYFLNHFENYSCVLAEIEAKQQNAPQAARYMLEAIAFGGVILIVLYLTGFNKNVSETIPLLALYAFSGYRLMPALQQIFSGLSLARYNYSALDILAQQLNNMDNRETIASSIVQKSLTIRNEIALEKIQYFYPTCSSPAIKNISLKIKMNTLVGFVGKTGSGKSTLAYILIGLLRPHSGHLVVDGQRLENHNIKSLQSIIGYVPQSIFLVDDTITKNIAFGLQDDMISFEAVQNAAKLANIHEYISSLPEGYNTVVGEKGIRLSGGQRQRIGIARALYHQPEILIFDEATSALDTITEKGVLDEIINLRKKITIVMIAHRLVTVKSCDNIFLFEDGKIAGEGTYDELESTSAIFQKMINV